MVDMMFVKRRALFSNMCCPMANPKPYLCDPKRIPPASPKILISGAKGNSPGKIQLLFNHFNASSPSG